MKKFLSPIVLLFALAMGLSSCDDSKSYAELLADENQAVNKFLVQFRVEENVPADGKFEIGENAPFYRLDDDSNVYMQVLDPGSDVKPEKNDRVYFRFTRYNMFYYVVGGDNSLLGTGNADNMNSASTFFLFENISISESSQYGYGIQLPMKYLGYDAKVNLVVKSQEGPSDEISYVVPYLYEVRYYKSQI